MIPDETRPKWRRSASSKPFQGFLAFFCSINEITKNLTPRLPPLRSEKRVDPLRVPIRDLSHSLRTEPVYVHWVRAVIRFHGIRRPATRAGPDVEQALGCRVCEQNLSDSAFRRASSALLFLDREVLGVTPPWLAEHGRKSTRMGILAMQVSRRRDDQQRRTRSRCSLFFQTDHWFTVIPAGVSGNPVRSSRQR